VSEWPGTPDPRLGDLDSQVAWVFREHSEAVLRTAEFAAGGNRARAEDAMQQAFIEALRYWPGFWDWPPSKQRAWLCDRVRKRVIDNWRKTHRELPTDSLLEGKEVRTSPSAEEITLSRDALEDCREAIESMPERAQLVAYLRWHEECTPTEVAELLGIDRATVSRDLRRVAAAVKEKAGDKVPFPLSDDDGEEA
jgi:RNA polymerase sigma factor (sigma-70 family)